jgi:hypothetical protein
MPRKDRSTLLPPREKIARPKRRRAPRLCARRAEWQKLLGPYVTELPKLVSQLSVAASQLEVAALQACDGFHGIGVRAREAVGGASRGLEKEIVRVVVALQFQDIVNQRITHAIETLTRLEGDLGACLAQTRPAPESRSDRAAPVYPLKESERCLLLTSNGAVKSSQTEPKGDIEIFLPEVSP